MKRRPRVGVIFLGQIGGLSGLLVTLFAYWSIELGAEVRRFPPYGVPISESLGVLFWLCGSILGLLGAWQASSHRKAGSLLLLWGGLLPLGSHFTLFPPISVNDSVLWGFIFFQWWSLLLVLAGVLVLQNYPRPTVT